MEVPEASSWEPPSTTQVLVVPSRSREQRAEPALLSLPMRVLVPSRGPHPHHITTSQRPRLQTPSPWGSGVRMWIWEDTDVQFVIYLHNVCVQIWCGDHVSHIAGVSWVSGHKPHWFSKLGTWGACLSSAVLKIGVLSSGRSSRSVSPPSVVCHGEPRVLAGWAPASAPVLRG